MVPSTPLATSCTETLLLFFVAVLIIFSDTVFLARVSSSLCIPDFLSPLPLDSTPPPPTTPGLWALSSTPDCSFLCIHSIFVNKGRQMKVCPPLVTFLVFLGFFPPSTRGSLFLIFSPPPHRSLGFLPSVRGGPAALITSADSHLEARSIPSRSSASGAPHSRTQVWFRSFWIRDVRSRGRRTSLCLPVCLFSPVSPEALGEASLSSVNAGLLCSDCPLCPLLPSEPLFFVQPLCDRPSLCRLENLCPAQSVVES